ncbi:MAG: hypothetical protein IKO65_06635, partial [Victivallales bacterium]|nr:hypothetical protein [Victivallales bacterium]
MPSPSTMMSMCYLLVWGWGCGARLGGRAHWEVVPERLALVLLATFDVDAVSVNGDIHVLPPGSGLGLRGAPWAAPTGDSGLGLLRL